MQRVYFTLAYASQLDKYLALTLDDDQISLRKLRWATCCDLIPIFLASPHQDLYDLHEKENTHEGLFISI